MLAKWQWDAGKEQSLNQIHSHIIDRKHIKCELRLKPADHPGAKFKMLAR